MNRKSVLISGLLIIIIVGFLTYFLLYNHGQNKLRISVDHSLSSEKFRIEQGFYSINEGSDENLIKMGLDHVVYLEGRGKGFETICGENDFLVLYDNEYYALFRHFIPNDFDDGIPEPHLYHFDFKRIGDKIHVTLDIQGQDEEKSEKVMAKVADAANSIWGRPIEK